MSGAEFIGRGTDGTYYLMPFPMLRAPALVLVTPPALSGTKAPGQVVTFVAGVYSGSTITSRTYRVEVRDLNGALFVSSTTFPFTIPAGAPSGSVRIFEGVLTSTGQVEFASQSYSITASSAAPVFSTQPSMSGSGVVGTTLTLTNGMATGTPAPTMSQEWQYLAAGATAWSPSSTTGLSRALTSDAPGVKFWARSIASNTAGTTYSDWTAPITVRTGDAILWPAIGGVGTAAGEAQSKPLPVYTANGPGYTGSLAVDGHYVAAMAYAAWQGNASVDARLLACMRNGLVSGRDPSMSMGYAAQQEIGFTGAAYFCKQTPRIWSSFSALERAKIDLLVRASMIAGAACSRETGDSGNGRNMLGFATNASTPQSNPNIRSGCRAAVLIGCAYFGGAAAGKAILDAVTTTSLTALYNDLVANGLANCAQSFVPGTSVSAARNGSGPSYNTIVGKCQDWVSIGVSISNPTGILAAELDNAFDQVVTAGYVKPAGLSLYSEMPAARGKFMVSVSANATYNAIAGLVGRCKEFNGVDDGPGSSSNVYPRSSASYAIWAIRVEALLALVCLHSGMVLPSGAASALERFRRGFVYQKLAGDVGYYNYAQGGTGSSENWTTAAYANQYGFSYTYGICELVVAASG